MKLLEGILSVLSSLGDVTLALLFYYGAIRPRDKMRGKRLLALFLAINTTICVSMSFLPIAFYIKSLMITGSEILFCWLASERRSGISALLPLMVFSLIYICEGTVSSTMLWLAPGIASLPAGDPRQMVYGIVESRLLFYASLGAVFTFLHRTRSKSVNTAFLTRRQWGWLCAGTLLLGSYAIVFSFSVNNAAHVLSPVLTALPAAFLIQLAIFAALFINLARETERKYQLQTELVKKDMQYEQQKALASLYQDVRGLQHDLKNHMQALGGLLEREETEKALRYVRRISEAAGYTGQWVDTGDAAVDALLNAKLHRARDAGIDVWAEIQYPDPPEVEVSDLCAILFNLIDNAIEACEKNKDAANRWLRLKMQTRDGFLVLYTENPSEQRPVKRKHGFQSTKQGLLHGYGTRQIEQIVDKYKGFFDLEYTDKGTFYATAALPHGWSEWVRVSAIRTPREGEETACTSDGADF